MQRPGVVERHQQRTGGDDHEAGVATGKQRPHLLGVGRVVEDEEGACALTRCRTAPTGLQRARDLPRAHADELQQLVEDLGRPRRVWSGVSAYSGT